MGFHILATSFIAAMLYGATPYPAGHDATTMVSPQSTLTLCEAERLTKRLLPAVAAAQADSLAAMARIRAAHSLWLPSLNASISYSRQTANFVLRPGVLPSSLASNAASAVSRGNSYNFLSGQLQVNQLLFDFGAASAAIAQARAYNRQTDSALRQAVAEAMLATRRAFFNAQAKRALAQVAQKSFANQLRHQQQVQQQVANGLRADIDLATAKTDKSLAQVNVVRAENAARTALAALMQAMGIEGVDAPYDVSMECSMPPPDKDQTLASWLQEAHQNRPELAGQGAQILQQQHNVRAIKATFWPQINAVGSFSDAGQDLFNLGWNYSAGAQLTWPLFKGGNTVFQLQEARLQTEKARTKLASLRQAIAFEVRTAAYDLEAAEASLTAAEDATQSAQLRLDLAERRYQTGLGSAIELGDAQLAWATAAGQKVQAMVDINLARASLVKALGRP